MSDSSHLLAYFLVCIQWYQSLELRRELVVPARSNFEITDTHCVSQGASHWRHVLGSQWELMSEAGCDNASASNAERSIVSVHVFVSKDFFLTDVQVRSWLLAYVCLWACECPFNSCAVSGENSALLLDAAAQPSAYSTSERLAGQHLPVESLWSLCLALD